MDLNNLSTAKAKLGLVVHNHPGHKPHLRQRYAVQDGQDIKEGQVISVVKNTVDQRLEFIRGFDADIDAGGPDTKLSKGNLIMIAYQNSDDGDVLNSGKLTGLSSVGGFEISTAYFDESSTYEVGDLVIPDATTGNLIPVKFNDDGTVSSDTSMFSVDPSVGAGATPIATYAVGRVVVDYAPPVDFAASYTANPGTLSGVSPGVTGATFQVGRRFGATDLRMLRIELIPPVAITIPDSGAV